MKPATEKMRDSNDLGYELEEVPGCRISLGELVVLINYRVGFADLDDSEPEGQVEHLGGEIFDEEDTGGVDDVDPEHMSEVVAKDNFSLLDDGALLVKTGIEVHEDLE